MVSVPGVVSTDPQEEQKLAPTGFRCPQLLQNTATTLPLRPRRLARVSRLFYERTVRRGVEQSLQRVLPGRLDLTDPPVAVGVVVQLLRSLRQ